MGAVNDPLLWSLAETARQLGGVSTRTVRRLLDRGDLSPGRVGRRLMVRADSVRAYVDRATTGSDNWPGAGPDVQEESTCQRADNNGIRTAFTVAPTPRTGGRRTSTQAAKELDALLAPKTAGKPRRFSPSSA
jgi:hypothetical protein